MDRFFASGKLKKVTVGGGVPLSSANVSGPMGATWGDDGHIIVAVTSGGLMKVRKIGGRHTDHQGRVRRNQSPLGHRSPRLGIHCLSAGIGGNFAAGNIVAQRSIRESERFLHPRVLPRYLASGHLGSFSTERFMPLHSIRSGLFPGDPGARLDYVKYARRQWSGAVGLLPPGRRDLPLRQNGSEKDGGSGGSGMANSSRRCRAGMVRRGQPPPDGKRRDVLDAGVRGKQHSGHRMSADGERVG